MATERRRRMIRRIVDRVLRWNSRRRLVRLLHCFNCGAKLIGTGQRHWLTVYRYTCPECGGLNHFDFETYKRPVRVRSHDVAPKEGGAS